MLERKEVASMAEIVKTICHMCNRMCGMNVYVEGSRMVKAERMPEHPVSRGSSCPRGLAAVQFVYDSGRPMHPVKRLGTRGEGKWECY